MLIHRDQTFASAALGLHLSGDVAFISLGFLEFGGWVMPRLSPRGHDREPFLIFGVILYA